MYPGTKTMSKEYRFGPEVVYILDKTFAYPELPEEIRAVKRQAYSYAHLRTGRGNNSQRQMKQARKHLLKAVILDPSYLKDPLLLIRLITSILGRRATEVASSWKVKLGFKPT